MKMIERIKGKEVVVMVDPGATHNFISLEGVQKMELEVGNGKSFGVSLGNGESMHGVGECKGVTVELKGYTVKEDFLPLKSGNPDLILGIQWLEKLGTVTTN